MASVREYNYDHVIDAHIAGRPIGWAGMVERDENIIEIAPILVDSEYRRLGIGKSIVLECMKTARREGYSTVQANTQLKYSKEFFQSLGFKIVDTYNNLNGKGWTLEKDINEEN